MTDDRAEQSPKTTDPLERIIEEALIAAKIPFLVEADGIEHRLDFHLPEIGIAVEVKRFYSPRSDAQLRGSDNVIFVQGEKAVRAPAAVIRAGGAGLLGAASRGGEQSAR